MFNEKDFDRQFVNLGRFAIIWFVVSAFISLSVLTFVGWVVVKLLSHFNVI